MESLSPEHHDPMIFARNIRSDGSTAPVAWRDVVNWNLKGQANCYGSISIRKAPGVLGWLRDDLHLNDATIDALTSDRNRPRAFHEGNALATILHGINGSDGSDAEDLVALQIWADERHIVTLRRRQLKAPKDVLAEIEASSKAITVGDLITKLIDRTVTHIGEVILDLNYHIDQLEEQCRGTAVEDVLTAISDIRRKCLALKRHMSPQHDALIHIARDGPDWLSADNRATIRETIDQLHHYLEDIDVTKESALVLQDDLWIGVEKGPR